jgi:DNA-directed RNA polymerase specialized sigma24 family protein
MNSDNPPPTESQVPAELLKKQLNGLLAIAMRLTRWDRARSEDLVQIAFLRAYNAKMRDVSWTYLRRALMTSFLDERRSFWHKYLRTMDELPEMPREDPIVETIQSGRIARELKDQLPETNYTVLMMWAEGYSSKETCKYLGLPRSTYAHALAHAKEAAQTWIQRYEWAACAAQSATSSSTMGLSG